MALADAATSGRANPQTSTRGRIGLDRRLRIQDALASQLCGINDKSTGRSPRRDMITSALWRPRQAYPLSIDRMIRYGLIIHGFAETGAPLWSSCLYSSRVVIFSI
jgi:hypothetical protein